MDITSIDNVSEEDGLVLLQSFLIGLSTERDRTPNDPLRRIIVAILPEYGEDGRLLRLDCLTVPAEDPGALNADMADLMTAADAIVKSEQAKRAAAYARLEAKPLPTVVAIPEGR